MEDLSHLDQQYFLDSETYNCPFCNRRNVIYRIIDHFSFDWSSEKACYGFITECSSCSNKSMHLSYEQLLTETTRGKKIRDISEIDRRIFYSVPTSFFVIDKRISKGIRELITEAEGCLKMNFLTGASACSRKAIYELTVEEKCEGTNYEERVKFLKEKYPDSDPTLFDILSHIKDMTSEKVHEQSWEEWDSKHLKLIIETLKAVLYDIYVLPKIKADRSHKVKKLLEEVNNNKNPPVAETAVVGEHQ